MSAIHQYRQRPVPLHKSDNPIVEMLNKTQRQQQRESVTRGVIVWWLTLPNLATILNV